MSEPTVPAVAAFDLDGTLTEGGSVFPWLRRVAGASAAIRAALRLALPLGIGALVSGSAADDAKEHLFHALLAGRDVDDVTAISRVFAEQHLRQKSRPRLVARLQWHLGEGHDVVVVSASPQIYVELIAGQLQAHGALGTRLAVDDLNQFTGRYLGENCRGDEKMRGVDRCTRVRRDARHLRLREFAR